MIVIIDYGVGNLGSIANMLKKVGAEAMISSNVSDIEKADKLILPGVGAFDNGMKNLNESGLVSVLNTKVIEIKTPILGICLGAQLFSKSSQEGELPGLGWIDAEMKRFRFDQSQANLKVPHMGWNFVTVNQSNPLFNDMYENARFYFVHSYHFVCHDEKNILAKTHYGYEFASAIVSENIMGTQFHPEKSHKFGMKLLKNFAEYF
jgi:glutamine amidotransferase